MMVLFLMQKVEVVYENKLIFTLLKDINYTTTKVLAQIVEIRLNWKTNNKPLWTTPVHVLYKADSVIVDNKTHPFLLKEVKMKSGLISSEDNDCN